MKNKGAKSDEGDKSDDGDLEAEECDMEVWNMLRKSFRQVQSVLEHNRLLIQQVNENQQSRISDNLVNNISLIHEINGNISRVISIYSDLSASFLTTIQQKRCVTESKSGENNGGRGIHE
ncbi:Protein EARLY FLOWERING 4, partial [Cucurbita argyrosperma subsp. argyrosperma]